MSILSGNVQIPKITVVLFVTSWFILAVNNKLLRVLMEQDPGFDDEYYRNLFRIIREEKAKEDERRLFGEEL